MFYEKSSSFNGAKKAKINVYDFSGGLNGEREGSVLPITKASVLFNVKCDSGAIKDGVGIKRATVNNSEIDVSYSALSTLAKKLYYYRRYDEEVGLYIDYLIVYAQNGSMYVRNLSQKGSFEIVPDLAFESEPVAVSYTYNGKDVIIFSSKSVMKIFDGNTVTQINDAPCITSMCIHSERLFATEGGQKTALWFSDDFDPLNWNVSLEDAGFIDFRDGAGSLLKVLSFGGYLYLFRNYGISRITAFGDQTQFSVDGIMATSGKINGGSITVCGDTIIYLAKDGFYSFTGGVPTRILTQLDSYIKNCDNTNAKGCYFNGVYYCLLNMIIDQKQCSVMLVYDVNKGYFTLAKGCSINDFTVLLGEDYFKLLFLCNRADFVGELSEKSEFFAHPLLKVWKSGTNDLGYQGEKTVTKISLFTKTPIKVRVKSEKGERILHFCGAKGMQTIALSLKGDLFEISIECDRPEMKVSRMQVEYEYYSR